MKDRAKKRFGWGEEDLVIKKPSKKDTIVKESKNEDPDNKSIGNDVKKTT